MGGQKSCRREEEEGSRRSEASADSQRQGTVSRWQSGKLVFSQQALHTHTHILSHWHSHSLRLTHTVAQAEDRFDYHHHSSSSNSSVRWSVLLCYEHWIIFKRRLPFSVLSCLVFFLSFSLSQFYAARSLFFVAEQQKQKETVVRCGC